MIGGLALVFAAPAFAGDATPGAPSWPLPQTQSQPRSQPQQKPATDMKTLPRESRDMDSIQERDGGHGVGEMLCQGRYHPIDSTTAKGCDTLVSGGII